MTDTAEWIWNDKERDQRPAQRSRRRVARQEQEADAELAAYWEEEED